MRGLTLEPSSPDRWREVRGTLRRLLAEGADPAGLFADGAQGSLLEPAPAGQRFPTPRFPRGWQGPFRRVAHHRDPDSLRLLYRLLHRHQTEKGLPERALDPDVRELVARDAAVRRDAHKAKAFVRFREVAPDTFAAWHRPDHHVLPLVAGFFARRFGDRPFAIFTPDATLHVREGELTWAPGAPRSAVPDADGLDDLWRTYYRATFNPARTNLKAMRAEMPAKHWSTLPETRDLRALVAEAPARVAAMAARAERQPTVADVLPERRSLETLREAAPACRACPLHGPATQVVFGEGPADARVVLVGEQPGDQEDRRGRPFVGPAGSLLREVMASVGLPPGETYLTNSVKHFRFRGKRRIHDRPRAGEVQACRPWLHAELELVKPEVLVLLGATATRSLLGSRVKFRDVRGKVVATPFAPHTVVTVHPSAILRAEDGATLKESLSSALALARSLLSPSICRAATKW
ncbi:MAG: uracil-DNA glycosylase [Sandaracinus sp.]|nr:uracil-DNA glycosylase [Sandaracinus sp.]